MRVCEILALRWRRVDLRTGTLRITERFYRGDFSTVKSKRSDHDLPLGSVALETLKNWRENRKGGPDDLVFATRTGKLMSDGNLRRRVIYPACDRLCIPRVSWHRVPASAQQFARVSRNSGIRGSGTTRARGPANHTRNSS